MRGLRTASGGSFRLAAMIGAIATFALAGATFAIAAPGGNGHNPGGLNNGGHSTSGGNSSCVTDTNCGHNPTEITKPCTTGTQGNGCHQLPDTPCDRGHGGTQMHNKHCGPSSLTSTPPTTLGTPPATAGTPPAGGTTSTKGKVTSTHPSAAKHGSSHMKSSPTGSGGKEGKESEGGVPSTPNASAAEAVTRTAAFTG